MIFKYIRLNGKLRVSSNYYIPPSPDYFPAEVITMTDLLNRGKRLVDSMSDQDKDDLKRYMNGKRAYNRGYGEIAKQVEAHITKHGHITNKEAYDRGYTSTLLDTTTFSRCIISKLTIEIGKKKLPELGKAGRKRVAFYDIKLGAPSDFSKIDDVLVEDILSKVDFRKKRNDLLPVITHLDYPALRKKGSLAKIRPLLRKAMAEKGYELIGSQLNFVRGD